MSSGAKRTKKRRETHASERAQLRGQGADGVVVQLEDRELLDPEDTLGNCFYFPRGQIQRGPLAIQNSCHRLFHLGEKKKKKTMSRGRAQVSMATGRSLAGP